MRLSIPLVGMHFRPPAKQLLPFIPLTTPLVLRPEPDNPYDPKAIQVWLDNAHLVIPDTEEVANALAGCGMEHTDLPDSFHLGYLADSDGKLGKAAGNREAHQLIQGLVPGVEDVLEAWAAAQGRFTAELGALPSGAPCVTLEALNDE